MATSVPKAAPKPAPKQLAETISLGRQVAIRSLDPQVRTTISHFMEPRQIYDALVTFDIAGEKIEPQLAASWNRINDTTIEFKLRDDIPSAFTKSIATLPTAYDRSIHLWKEGRKGSLATACILGPSLFGEGRL